MNGMMVEPLDLSWTAGLHFLNFSEVISKNDDISSTYVHSENHYSDYALDLTTDKWVDTTSKRANNAMSGTSNDTAATVSEGESSSEIAEAAARFPPKLQNRAEVFKHAYSEEAWTVHRVPADTVHIIKSAPRVLVCALCYTDFESFSSMRAHITRQHNAESLTCFFCRKRFRSIDSLGYHCESICGAAKKIGGVYVFACDKCPKISTSPRNLRRHLCRVQAQQPQEVAAKTNEKFHPCPSCEKSFPSVKSRCAHMKAHVLRASQSSPRVVKVVLKRAELPAGIVRGKAVSVHDGEPSIALRDPNSDVHCSTKKSIFTSSWKYKCRQCPKAFKKPQALATHSRIHEFVCKLCPKAFMNVKALESHSETHRHSTGSVTMPSETKNVAPSTRPRSVSVGGIATQPEVKLAEVANRSDSKIAATVNLPPASKVVEVTRRPNPNANSSTANGVANDPDHRATNLPPPKIVYACQRCPRKFLTRVGFVNHSRAHSRDDGAVPIRRNPISAHLSAVNVAQKAVIAGTLVTRPDVVASQPDRTQPARIVDGDLAYAFPCGFCERTFTTHRGYAHHVWIHTRDSSGTSVREGGAKPKVGKPFECWFCGAEFATDRKLDEHIQRDPHNRARESFAGRAAFPNACNSVHVNVDDLDSGLNGQGAFTCDTCDETFDCWRELSEHVRDHADPSLPDGEYAATLAAPAPDRVCVEWLIEKNFNEPRALEGVNGFSPWTDWPRNSRLIVGGERAFSPGDAINPVNGESMENAAEATPGPPKRARVCASSKPKNVRTDVAVSATISPGRVVGQTSNVENRPNAMVQFRENPSECVERQPGGGSASVQPERYKSKAFQGGASNLQTRDHFMVLNGSGGEEHATADGYRCTECGQTFREKLRMFVHLSHHVEEEREKGDSELLPFIEAELSLLAPFRCYFCGERFIDKEYRNAHLCRRLRGEQNGWRSQCERYGTYFRSKGIQERHAETECKVGAANGAYEADYGVSDAAEKCTIKQEPIGQIDSEVKNDGGLQFFICDCCNKKFVSKSDMRAHENEPQKLLSCCGLCNLYFMNTDEAEEHSKAHYIKQEKDLNIST